MTIHSAASEAGAVPSITRTEASAATTSISRAQLRLTEAGQTTSRGPPGARCRSETIACRVLPRPMSSARMARRRPSRKATPSIWCGKSPSASATALLKAASGSPDSLSSCANAAACESSVSAMTPLNNVTLRAALRAADQQMERPATPPARRDYNAADGHCTLQRQKEKFDAAKKLRGVFHHPYPDGARSG